MNDQNHNSYFQEITLSVARKTVLAGMAAFVIAVGLGFSRAASAHNIDVNQAKQKVEAYARKVARERNYQYFNVHCVPMFRGHNHQVKCTARYQNENTRKANRWSCVEDITVYFQAHRGDKRNWEYYMVHPNRMNSYPPEPCGNDTLTGPMP